MKLTPKVVFIKVIDFPNKSNEMRSKNNKLGRSPSISGRFTFLFDSDPACQIVLKHHQTLIETWNSSDVRVKKKGRKKEQIIFMLFKTYLWSISPLFIERIYTNIQYKTFQA